MLATNYNNLLLAALPGDELEILRGAFQPVELPRRTQLELPNKKIDHIYFLESGIASIVATSMAKKEVEVGIIGREGMTGLAVLHLNDRYPYSAYMQIDGTAQRIEADAVRDAMERSLACRRVFLGFAQSFLIQVAETAVVNARGTVEERLARWLLMAEDRVGNPEIPLTHEFLSLMMAARRAGVTEASHELARKGLIAGKRGRIVVLDRDALEERAGDFYGAAERELKRILGGNGGGADNSALRKPDEPRSLTAKATGLA